MAITTHKRRAFLAGSAATAVAINYVRKPGEAAEFEYKIGTNVPMNDPRNVNIVLMSKRLLNETGWKFKLTLYPNNQLGGDTAMFTQLRSGALEFFTISGGILSSVVPVCDIQGVPFAFKSIPNVYQAMDGDLGAYLRKQILAKGIQPMPHMLDNGFRQVTNSVRPIKTVDDLKGLKIRTPPGKLWVDLFKTLGASVIGMNFSELYTALQTHVVDGQENPYIIEEIGRLYEVQKYLSVTNHMWDGFWVIANQDKWNALGGPLQETITKNMIVYAKDQRRDNDLLNESLSDKLQRQGMVFNKADVATFKAKLAADKFYERWRDTFGAEAWSTLEKYTGKLV
ncbi:MAG: TRAP transporter substrate-binding protein [Candidatus Eremiobacteraeota bacterium]|nr:TRAP transporter substrate-binding protein [Candidatus Eremiobacteraeota bacterium]